MPVNGEEPAPRPTIRDVAERAGVSKSLVSLVLRGSPKLRTPDGDRVLEEGEVVHFPRGPAGAHGIQNDTDEAVRYVMVSDHPSPEVAEYPELGQITAQARTGSQTGERLWFVYDVPSESD